MGGQNVRFMVEASRRHLKIWTPKFETVAHEANSQCVDSIRTEIARVILSSGTKKQNDIGSAGERRISNSPANNIEKTPKPRVGLLSSMVVHHMSAAKRDDLNELFAKVTHEKTTYFNFFEHPSWIDFFNEATSAWNIPPPRHTGGNLLENLYVETMRDVVDAIRKAGGGVFGIEGDTKPLAK